MSIYHNGQKVAGYTSGRNSAILSNVTLLPGEFKTQEDGTYMCTLDNTLVLDESIVDVYFASSSQKAGSKANIWVSSAAGKIYFHAKKVPTQGLVAETIRIVNPSQDDSYNADQSVAITGLQQPVFEDYNNIFPSSTDTNHTNVDVSKLPNYSETPENDEPLNYIIPSLGKVKSKNPVATVLEGVKGALSWSAFLISNLKANVTKLQTDLTKLQTDLTSHISDYENISNMVSILKKNTKIGYIQNHDIDTLSSPSQLTHSGYYQFVNCSSTVNDNASTKFTDYQTGDFVGLLITRNGYTTSDAGCQWGTFIITSPRFTNKLWIGQIWEYKFINFIKIGS